MDEDFITDGLESNRYLKADKLVQRFRKQISDELETVSEQIVENHPELFDEDVDLDYNEFGVENSRTLTTIRVEFEMNSEHETYGPRLLNLGLEWVEPEEQDRDDVSGTALCYVLYKVQRGADARFSAVQQQTAAADRWNQIQFGDDQWPYKRKEAPGIIYIPVTNGSEIAHGLQTLQRHFSEEYAPVLLD